MKLFVLQKEEMFLELFEDEYNEMHKEILNVQRLLSDSTLLLPPAHSPMTGIPLSKRLPCGDVCTILILTFILIIILALQFIYNSFKSIIKINYF